MVLLFIPPLRQRRGDIPLLAEYILNTTIYELGREPVTLSVPALDIMLDYEWPGNVRELQNVIQFATVQCQVRVIGPEHLPPHLLEREESIWSQTLKQAGFEPLWVVFCSDFSNGDLIKPTPLSPQERKKFSDGFQEKQRQIRFINVDREAFGELRMIVGGYS